MSDSAILWTVALQAPPSMGFSRQARWSGLLHHPPGNWTPTLTSPTLAASSLQLSLPGKPSSTIYTAHLLTGLLIFFKVELWEVFKCVCTCVWHIYMTSLVVHMVKNLPAMQIGSRRSPGEGNGIPFHDLVTKKTASKGHLNLLSTTFKYITQYC